MDTNLILSNIAKHITLDRDVLVYFTSLLKNKELKKKDFLLKEGEPCTTFNFVNSGALRAFYRDDDDKEATIMFAIADWWITDMPCFVKKDPAMIYIQAISDTCVLQIRKDDMDELYIKVPKFERFFDSKNNGDNIIVAFNFLLIE